MNSVGFTSEHTLREPIVDQNNQTYPAGTPVICDNMDTQVGFPVTWSGGLSELTIQLKGYTTGDYKNLTAYPNSVIDTSGSATYEYVIKPLVAPLSISTQSIIVNPKPITVTNVKGFTYVRAQGTTLGGSNSNIVTSPNAIPVVDCAN